LLKSVSADLSGCWPQGSRITNLIALHLSRRASPLANRELDFIGLLAERLSRQEIADRLCISTKAVKRHVESIYIELGVAGGQQAVAEARKLASLSSPPTGNA
jgi:ATP/maltotriose-dependent transcriptional regulator MalT